VINSPDEIRPDKAGPAWDRIFLENGVRPNRLERLVARDAYEAGRKDAAAILREAVAKTHWGKANRATLDALAKEIEP
jgi:hypothetical protein